MLIIIADTLKNGRQYIANHLIRAQDCVLVTEPEELPNIENARYVVVGDWDDRPDFAEFQKAIQNLIKNSEKHTGSQIYYKNGL